MAAAAALIPALLALLLLLLIAAAAAFYWHVTRASPIDAAPLPLAPAPLRTGAYARNALLQGATKLGVGRLPRPEDIAADAAARFLYVSTSDGWIKKLHLKDNSVEDWKHVGGRPLGLALAPSGELIVCEGSRLLSITENHIHTLTSDLKFANAAAVADNGLIYFTDSSTKYTLENFWWENFEGRANGRVLVYDPRQKTTRVLLKDLYLPNGIAISRCNQFLVFAETTAARIVKYYLQGEKAGEMEVMNENLPGFPDNVHYDESGELLYVGVIGERDAVVDWLWRTPFWKKVMVVYPCIRAAFDRSPRKGRVVVMDGSGRVVKVYEDPTGKVVGFVTVGVEVGGCVYVGGMRDDFVGRVEVQHGEKTIFSV